MEARREDSARGRLAALAKRADEDIDLAEAAFLIAAEEYPGLDVAACMRKLDEIAGQVAARLPDDGGDLERLAAFTAYLHGECSLRGNEEEYYDPRNSFLNDVLERGVGIPITLAVLYMEIGRRVGLPLQGVGFPAHFLVKHGGCEDVYVDPFHGGCVLHESDCRALLERLTGGQVPFDKRYLAPVSNRQILVRMLNNLKGVYLRRRQYEKAISATDRILLFSPNAAREYRDRGAIYLQIEAFRLALADLEEYLERGPEPDDRDAIHETVRVLRHRVEMLN